MAEDLQAEPRESHTRFPKVYWLYLVLALLMMPRLFWGETYYPGDILYSHPLWYDNVHTTDNYDLIDPIALYYSHDSLYNQGLKSGRLITWNPYSFCGHPIFADGKSGMLYPPKLLLHFLLSTTWAHDLFILLHLVASGCCMHLFLKGLKLSPTSCVVGSALWMLNGLQATWLESEFVAVFGAWLPLSLHLLQGGLTRDGPRARTLVGASVSLGALGFCGLVQFWAHTLLLAGVWTLYLCYQTRSWKNLVAGGLALAGPIPLAAVQLLPMFELVSRSQRITRELSYQIATFQKFLLGLPALLLSPDAFGNPTRGLAIRYLADRGDWVMLEYTVFLGVAGLVFLALGLFFRGGHSRFFLIALLVVALVPATPLYWVAFKFLPGFSQTISTRFVFLIVFFLCILAAHGAEVLLKTPSYKPAIFKGSLVVTALWLTTLAAVAFFQNSRPEWWTARLQSLLAQKDVRFPFEVSFPSREIYLQEVTERFINYYTPTHGVWLWVTGALIVTTLWLAPWGKRSSRTILFGLLFLAVFDMLRFSWQFNTTTTRQFLQEPPPAVDYLVSQPGFFRTLGLGTIRPNTTNPFRLRTVEGHNSIVPKRNVAYANAIENNDPYQIQGPFTTQTFPLRNPVSPLIHQASARYLVALPGHDLTSLGYESVFAQPNGLVVWKNLKALPMVRVTERVRAVDNFADALVGIYRTTDPKEAFLEVNQVEESGKATREAEVRGTRPGYWMVSAEGPGWLILGEAYDPGWTAIVDGVAQTTVPAQGLFQAVKLPVGNHVVTFRYFPVGLNGGLKISSVTAFLLLLVWLASFYKGWSIKKSAPETGAL